VKLKAYETQNGRVPFEEWFGKLDGVQRRAVQRRLRAIEDSDHFGDRRNLRGGLHELKFRQALRIYFTEVDGNVVVLLGGSGKRDQGREVDKARDRLKDFKRRID
jgi:putative addiction module killer protein